MKKLITLLLCLSLSLAAAGCASGASKSGDATSAAGSATAETSAGETEKKLSIYEQRQLVKDGLPEKDYKAANITIAADSFCQDGFYIEELTGDVVGDAVYERNKAVEDRFNVKLVYKIDTWKNSSKNVSNSVLAGEDAYQIVAGHVIQASTLVPSHIYMNWYDIPYVDLEQPWWSSSNIEDLTYKGVLLLAAGDFSLTTIGRTYCMIYDKVMAESYKIGDVYKIVDDGAWTIDKLSTLTKDIYTDVNNDGKRDTGDYYGFTTSVASNIGAYLWAFDNPIMEEQADGSMKLVIYTEKVTSMLEKLCDICYNNKGTYYDVNYKNAAGNLHYVGSEKMAAGTSLFSNCFLESTIVYLRDFENDFAIIPYPKWDEKQSEYRTMVDGGFTALIIPMSVKDTERSGILTTALCAETYKEVVPIYYDTALKVKGARDEKSIEMIDFIMDCRVFDFGFIYGGWNGFGFTLEGLVKEQNTNFASYYAANESKVSEYYKSVTDALEEYTK